VGVQVDQGVCLELTRLGIGLSKREVLDYNPEQFQPEVLAQCAKDETQRFLDAIRSVLEERRLVGGGR